MLEVALWTVVIAIAWAIIAMPRSRKH